MLQLFLGHNTCWLSAASAQLILQQPAAMFPVAGAALSERTGAWVFRLCAFHASILVPFHASILVPG